MNDPQGHAYNRLVALGYQPHIAAGLVGNLVQESGPNLKTDAVGDNGNSIGAGQWNGPRKTALLQFASSRGADPYSLDTQIDFLDHELRTSEASAGRKIAAATTPQEAALVASREFWRPGDPWNDNRVRYAESAYSKYGGGQPANALAPVAREVPQLTAANSLAWAPAPQQANALMPAFNFSTPDPYRMSGYNTLMRG